MSNNKADAKKAPTPTISREKVAPTTEEEIPVGRRMDRHEVIEAIIAQTFEEKGQYPLLSEVEDRAQGWKALKAGTYKATCFHDYEIVGKEKDARVQPNFSEQGKMFAVKFSVARGYLHIWCRQNPAEAETLAKKMGVVLPSAKSPKSPTKTKKNLSKKALKTLGQPASKKTKDAVLKNLSPKPVMETPTPPFSERAQKVLVAARVR